MTSDFWIGLGVGLVAGILVGVVWADVYELVKAAMSDLKKDGSKPFSRTTMFWIVIVFAAAQMVAGVFNGYAITQYKNLQQCVFDYNQRFALAFDAITDSSRIASDKDYEWKKEVPELFEPGNDDRDLEQFKKALNEYLNKYENLQRARISDSYPPIPSEFCGSKL